MPLCSMRMQRDCKWVLCLDEASAVLKLDNVEIGQTPWKTLGPQCWSQHFVIDVERVRIFVLLP